MKLWERWDAKGNNKPGVWEHFSKTADCSGIKCVECPFNHLCQVITYKEVIMLLNRDVPHSVEEQLRRK